MTKEQQEVVNQLERTTNYEDYRGYTCMPVLIKDLKMVIDLLKEKDEEVKRLKGKKEVRKK